MFPTDVDFWRCLWAVQYVLKVLLPSFQLFFVGFCESPIFQFDLLALYFLACEILYNPVNCLFFASLCSLLGFAGFEVVPCLLISSTTSFDPFVFDFILLREADSLLVCQLLMKFLLF